MAKQRGTTMRVRFDPDPTRKAPWGVWWNVYREGFKGRPKQKSQWFATEKEALEFKRLTLAAIEAEAPVSSVLVSAPTDTLAGFAPTFLEHIEDQREAATHRSYASLLAVHVLPELGTLLIADRTFKAAVLPFYKTLHRKGVALATRRHVHTCLSSLASFAAHSGLLSYNPLLKMGQFIKVRGEEEQRPEPNPFSPKETSAILDQVGACERAWVAYFQFLLDTGVRVGEAAALKWTALDLDAAMARIEFSYSPSAKGDKLPKTHERRDIDLTSTVVEQLREWRRVQREALMRRGLKPSPYVFTNLRGQRRLPDGNMRRVFDRVMAACEIVGHTPHDFRDTFATGHLTANWNRKLDWVSRQLGHATPGTTAKYYHQFRPTKATKGFADEIREWAI